MGSSRLLYQTCEPISEGRLTGYEKILDGWQSEQDAQDHHQRGDGSCRDTIHHGPGDLTSVKPGWQHTCNAGIATSSDMAAIIGVAHIIYQSVEYAAIQTYISSREEANAEGEPAAPSGIAKVVLGKDISSTSKAKLVCRKQGRGDCSHSQGSPGGVDDLLVSTLCPARRVTHVDLGYNLVTFPGDQCGQDEKGQACQELVPCNAGVS